MKYFSKANFLIDLLTRGQVEEKKKTHKQIFMLPKTLRKKIIINLLFVFFSVLRHLLCVLQRSTFSLEQIQTNYLSLCVLWQFVRNAKSQSHGTHTHTHSKREYEWDERTSKKYWKSLSKIFSCSHYSGTINALLPIHKNVKRVRYKNV